MTDAKQLEALAGRLHVHMQDDGRALCDDAEFTDDLIRCAAALREYAKRQSTEECSVCGCWTDDMSHPVEPGSLPVCHPCVHVKKLECELAALRGRLQVQRQSSSKWYIRATTATIMQEFETCEEAEAALHGS